MRPGSHTGQCPLWLPRYWGAAAEDETVDVDETGGLAARVGEAEAADRGVAQAVQADLDVAADASDGGRKVSVGGITPPTAPATVPA